jgi:plasmid stabilization system protein ParE
MGLKATSLIGGEDARIAIINRIKRLGLNPEAGSRKAEFKLLEGDYRSVEVWDYRIYYKVESKRVVVLDIFIDKDKNFKA